jgi:hypothetical protein
MGPVLLTSQGKSAHSKQRLTPFLNAQEDTAQKGFSFGVQPVLPLGHVPLTILGHFSHAIPQTPIFIALLLNSCLNYNILNIFIKVDDQDKGRAQCLKMESLRRVFLNSTMVILM